MKRHNLLLPVFKLPLLLTLCLLTITSCTESPRAFLQLPSYIGESAVFQRDEPIIITGFTTPNTTVTGTLGSVNASTQSDNTGSFSLKFKALEVQKGLMLSVSTRDTALYFSDINIGDVWLASGQSNMEWLLKATNGAQAMIQKTDLPDIRFFDTPKDMEFSPTDTLRKKASWIKGNDKEGIAEVSAVAFYFAEKLHTETDVPIGIIISSWGGTRAESWQSSKSIEQIEYLKERLELIPKGHTVDELNIKNQTHFKTLMDAVYQADIGFKEQWYLPQADLSDWKSLHVPGYWEDQIEDYKDFDGSMWYRRKFDLKPSFTGQDIRMWLSQIDDHDQVWINGAFIGETFEKEAWTNYLIPAELLKPQGNEIVIRVFDIGGKGGLTGLENYFDFFPDNDKSVRGKLNGTWLVKAGSKYTHNQGEEVIRETITPNSYPTLLFNTMIHPFKKVAFKGVIWYQGESNVEHAYRYRKVFPALIEDWRTFFERPELPFYFVQLANFGALTDLPKPSAWAELRAAQTMTLSLPFTGMASAIDLGDADDIHPRNKKDVGYRLAMHALKNQYGYDELITDGPIYEQHQVTGNKIVVTFNNAEGLQTSNGKAPAEFAIASAEGDFVWAQAKVEGHKVILESSEVPEPVHVRYAWSDAPIVNLFNAAGLPAYPFRTDDRPPYSCCLED